MKIRKRQFVLLVCVAAIGLSGCRRNLVRAAPPSVASPPQTEPMPQPTANPQMVTPQAAEPPEVPANAGPIPAVGPQPRPRPPVEAEAPKPNPEPAPAPPVIAPQLSAKEYSTAKRATEIDIPAAERNLQLANGRQLNANQQDMVDKIRGFLAQAHEAVGANDWVRAQNLAHKALILSSELVKTL